MTLITETNTAVATRPTHIILGYSEYSQARVAALLERLCGSQKLPTNLPAEVAPEKGLAARIGGGGDPELTRWLKVEVDHSGRNPKYSHDLVAFAEQAIVVDSNNNCLEIRKHRNTCIPIPPMHHLGGLPVFVSHGYAPDGQ